MDEDKDPQKADGLLSVQVIASSGTENRLKVSCSLPQGLAIWLHLCIVKDKKTCEKTHLIHENAQAHRKLVASVALTWF
jgi:hypothetical protein